MIQASWYFIKIIICSGVLFGYYWFFLRNKIYHQYNRFYLLLSVILSLLLPLIKINIWHHAAQSQSQAIQLLQAVTTSDQFIEDIAVKTQSSNLTAEQLAGFAYILVCAVFFLVFIHVLFSIRSLIYKYKGQVIEQFFFVNTHAKGTPFSFLNYIFWNDAIDIESNTGKQIFKHEVAHVKEKHSYDKLFINILLIACWFNPFFWLIRKELNMIHEFVADRHAVEDCDTEAFAAMILQATYPQHQFQLVNNFFYSPIKRRLTMLTKNKNPRINYASRVLALPLAALVFAAFTFKAKPLSQTLIAGGGQKFIVVIDAGHGGDDAGARATTGELEKNINLDICKKIREINSGNNIEILLTRDEDIYQSPKDKVAFAKSMKADLFISLHMDNVPEKAESSYSGMTVFIPKNDNPSVEKSKLLASALINEFKSDYALPVSSAPIQREIGNIWVLKANECPSVLIEAGYMSNKKDLDYIKTEDAKATIAKNILKAISKFRGQPVQTQQLAETATGNVPKQVDDNMVFAKVETEAMFPGGADAWQKYLQRNLDASIPIQEGWKPGTYKIILKFVVKKDGSLADITTTNYKKSKTATHCIDIIKKGPKWSPAMQNGKAVNAYKMQPITFVVTSA